MNENFTNNDIKINTRSGRKEQDPPPGGWGGILMVHPVLGGANFVHFTEDLAAQFLVIFLNCVTPLKSLFTPPGGWGDSLIV